MSKVVASEVPTGYQIVSCTAYSDRIATLYEGAANNNIVGWTYQSSVNEKWTFDRQGTTGNKYKISTRTTGSGETVYASSSDPVSGNPIYCTSSATVYDLVPLTEDEGIYRISITASDGTVLFWTLDNDTEGTAITLEEDNGTSIQIWAIYEPSD